MSEMRCDAVVIGAGLGGLTAAALLAKTGRNVKLIERNTPSAARPRCSRSAISPSSRRCTRPPTRATPTNRNTRSSKSSACSTRSNGFQSRPSTPSSAPVGEAFDLPSGFDAAREALSARFPAQQRA